MGWDSVTNPNPASIGSDVESDGQLRLRRTLSTAISAITPVDSLTAALLKVIDVSDVLIFENDTNSNITLKDSSDLLPAKTITAVVEGGDQEEIAEEIRLKKTLGCGTFGDTTVDLIDSIGQTVQYKFERPNNVDIYVAITIQVTSKYSDPTDDLIQQALVDEINNTKIASDITSGALFNAVYDADPLSDGQRTYQVTILNFGTAPAPATNTTVAIAWNKTSFTDQDFSKITLAKV